MRILVLSHGHPELNAGGGEKAAYALFQRLKADARVSKAVFVARAEQGAIGHDAVFGSFRGRQDEILAAPPPVNGLTFQSFGYDALRTMVDDLVRTVRPDVVHIHHFIFWGAEIFELFRQAGVRVVFTFHEYSAICANFGQMVKRDGRLCYSASPAECSQCIGSVSAGKFFIRNTMLRDLLNAADSFIAPSAFLKERYVAWGLPAERITVAENLLDHALAAGSLPACAPAPDAHPSDDARKRVFGYFAQINPFKGYDVLLEAASLLPDDVRRQVTIRVHGENRHYRETAFQERIDDLLRKVRDVVSPLGEYRSDNVIDLMSACDWIVVPSIWWENSPVVMQEARLSARSILAADIGGMAEKIDATVDRVFAARSPGALAEQITAIVRARTVPDHKHLTDLAKARIQADGAHFATHMGIYRHLLPTPDFAAQGRKVRAR